LYFPVTFKPPANDPHKITQVFFDCFFFFLKRLLPSFFFSFVLEYTHIGEFNELASSTSSFAISFLVSLLVCPRLSSLQEMLSGALRDALVGPTAISFGILPLSLPFLIEPLEPNSLAQQHDQGWMKGLKSFYCACWARICASMDIF
jgi:hypothetical protein